MQAWQKLAGSLLIFPQQVVLQKEKKVITKTASNQKLHLKKIKIQLRGIQLIYPSSVQYLDLVSSEAAEIEAIEKQMNKVLVFCFK